MERKQTCNFVTKTFVKKSPDEDEKIESDDENLEEKSNLILPDEKTIEEINKEFDILDIPQQKLVYAFLTRSHEEFYNNRSLMLDLDYVAWVITMELQYDTNWEALKEIIGQRKIMITNFTEIKEVAKWGFICIIRYKFRGQVIGEYITKEKSVECICANGHTCKPKPGSVLQGRGICRICSGCDKQTAKNKFYHIVETIIGGKVVGIYKDNRTCVECICPNGHKCSPLPGSLFRGRGMCKICSGDDVETAKQKFYENIKKMGGKVLGEYITNATKVKCQCPKGHICYPNPNNIAMGHYMCKECTDIQSQSKGEKMLLESLRTLNMGPVLERYAPKIVKRHKNNGIHLRYDATIITKKMTYYYEYHGEQHEKFSAKFHKTEEDFTAARQRDLVKIHIIRQIPNAKLIVLDHKWARKPIEKWIEYLRKATNSKEKIVAESPLHDWVRNGTPTQENIDKYIISD